MENLVAIKVLDEEDVAHYFMTWGRVFNAVDPTSLLEAVTPHLPRFGIHNCTSIALCISLREVSAQMYFYEALFHFGQTKIPFGGDYESWREQQREKIISGKEIYYLGKELK